MRHILNYCSRAFDSYIHCWPGVARRASIHIYIDVQAFLGGIQLQAHQGHCANHHLDLKFFLSFGPENLVRRLLGYLFATPTGIVLSVNWSAPL